MERKARRNRDEKKPLVEQGRAHGILVYDGAEPVGWCQYGPREELPRVDVARSYKALGPDGGEKIWRVTCLSVDRAYRRREVAKLALAAALDSLHQSPGWRDSGGVSDYPQGGAGGLVRDEVDVREGGVRGRRALREEQCRHAGGALSGLLHHELVAVEDLPRVSVHLGPPHNRPDLGPRLHRIRG